MICVTRKYSAENYVFFFDKVVVLGFDLVSGAITRKIVSNGPWNLFNNKKKYVDNCQIITNSNSCTQ